MFLSAIVSAALLVAQSDQINVPVKTPAAQMREARVRDMEFCVRDIVRARLAAGDRSRASVVDFAEKVCMQRWVPLPGLPSIDRIRAAVRIDAAREIDRAERGAN